MDFPLAFLLTWFVSYSTSGNYSGKLSKYAERLGSASGLFNANGPKDPGKRMLPATGFFFFFFVQSLSILPTHTLGIE